MKTFLHWPYVSAIALLALLWAAWAMAATEPAPAGKVIVYRCVDGKGTVSLQGSPCASTSKQETREMVIPKDAPAVKQTPVSQPAPIVVQAPAEPIYEQSIPPPKLYKCTDYEGKTRDSESYDPNPRCESLWALGYDPKYFPRNIRSNSCRWIEDSCVRYEGRALCERWKEKQKQAVSDVRYAFSDTLEYRKSELARLTQIVDTSCR